MARYLPTRLWHSICRYNFGGGRRPPTPPYVGPQLGGKENQPETPLAEGSRPTPILGGFCLEGYPQIGGQSFEEGFRLLNIQLQTDPLLAYVCRDSNIVTTLVDSYIRGGHFYGQGAGHSERTCSHEYILRTRGC